VKRLLLPLLFALTISAYLAPAAQADILAEKVGDVLVVSSDEVGAADESYTLRDEGPNVIVMVSPGTMPDPDGAGGECSVSAAGEEVVCVRAGTSSVQIVAGGGIDTIDDNRTQGPSLLEGGFGDDQITTGVSANATVLGQGGEDTLTSAGVDWLHGGTKLDGGPEADTLIAVGNKAFDGFDSGGLGNDTFIGNPDRADQLIADSGADTYKLGTYVPVFGDPAISQLDQYPDSVSYYFVNTPVAVSLDGVANDGRSGEQDNVGADVEVVEGGDGGDLLLGGPGPDRLDGRGGNDVLRGNDGDDELDDGDFTVAIISGPQPPSGNDVLDGGSGDDFLLSDRGADDLSGGPGIDRTSFSRPIPQDPSVLTPVAPAGFTVSLDNVANDGQTGSGEGDNLHTDVEVVESSGGNDVITGSGGFDEIGSGAGADVINPGGGPDVVDLGSGDDHVEAVDRTVDSIRCRAGSDTANVDLPGAKAAGDQLFDCENVTGTPMPAGADMAPPGPVGDTTRPAVTLTSKAIKPGTFLDDGHIDLTVSCDEACSVSGKAYKTPAKKGESPIGDGSLKLGTGKRTLRVTVAKKLRTQFESMLRTKAQKRRGVKLRVVLVIKDAAGNVTNASRTVTVKG
jgi:hypothetical protein